MRHLEALSDLEFEALVADLLSSHTGHSYERFGRGRDGGIDLRFVNLEEGTVEVVQCKHYARSSFSQLAAAAKAEVEKLERQEPPPDSYRLVTSQSLTPGQKEKLIEALGGWIEDPGLIWGAEAIDDRLNEHPEVERRHVKLWLSSNAQLERLRSAATLNRSNDLIERMTHALPRYVHTTRFHDAQRILEKEGVCLIAGEPGIGKTTLAQMLLLHSAGSGFEPLYVSQDIGEAWEALADQPQAFYYDDFLGRVGLGLSKNEDQRLVDLIRRAQRDPRGTRLILTTREYILRSAIQLYETFDRAELDHTRFLLALPDYSRYERGLVLYNHLYHSDVMKDEWISEVVSREGYLRIVDHKNYSPRLIEFITGHAKPREVERVDGDWLKFALESLDHPEEIWKRAFEIDLTELQQATVVCVVSFGFPVGVEDLRHAVGGLCASSGIPFSDAEIDRSLAILELSFLGFGSDSQGPTVDVANPSISDFVLNRICAEPRALAAFLEGAVFFTQVRQILEVAANGSGRMLSQKLVETLRQEHGKLVRSLIRTFDNPPPHSMEDFESRLRILLAAVGELSSSEESKEWLGGVAGRLGDQWEEGQVQGKDSLEVYLAYRRFLSQQARVELGVALKRGLRRSPMRIEDFEALGKLEDVDPEVFQDGERERLVASFEEFAYDLLLRGTLELEDIRSIARVARKLDADLDEVVLREAENKSRWRNLRDYEKREKLQEQEWNRMPESIKSGRAALKAMRSRESDQQVDSTTKLRELFRRLG
jgi:hypothetical protein